MKRSVMFGLFLALIVVSVAFAQGKPNFSGKWTPEQAAAGGGGGRGMGGGPMTVTQTDKTLTVERMRGEQTIKSVYNLDGSESKNQSMGRGGETTEVVSVAKWDGAKLVITTKTANGEMTQTWSMAGDKLQIEQPGQGGNMTTRTYTKG